MEVKFFPVEPYVLATFPAELKTGVQNQQVVNEVIEHFLWAQFLLVL